MAIDLKIAAARDAADEIIKDLSDRRGFRQAWEQCDAEIQDEIRSAWTGLIAGIMATPSPAAPPPTVVREALLASRAELEGWEKCAGIEAALAKIDAGLEALDRLSAPPPPPVEGPGLAEAARRLLADLGNATSCPQVWGHNERTCSTCAVRSAIAAEKALAKVRREDVGYLAEPMREALAEASYPHDAGTCECPTWEKEHTCWHVRARRVLENLGELKSTP